MRSYRTLALVATFFKIIGWLTVIITVISACGLLVVGVGGGFALPSIIGENVPALGVAGGVLSGALSSALVLIVGLLYGALEIASAELIELFIDLSTSSQRSVQLLERLVSAPLQPRPVLPPPPPPPAAPTPQDQ